MTEVYLKTENLQRYHDTLKRNVISDINVDTNKLNVSFLDNHAKTLTLPSGGSNAKTLSSERQPIIFELHFGVKTDISEPSKSGNPYSGYTYNFDENVDTTKSTSKINGLTADDIKLTITGNISNSVNGVQFTIDKDKVDVVESPEKAYDNNDTCFTVFVNLNTFAIFNQSYGSQNDVNISLGFEFFNSTLEFVDEKLLRYFNERKTEGTENITSIKLQMNTDTLSMTHGSIGGGDLNAVANYFIVNAVFIPCNFDDNGDIDYLSDSFVYPNDYNGKNIYEAYGSTDKSSLITFDNNSEGVGQFILVDYERKSDYSVAKHKFSIDV